MKLREEIRKICDDNMVTGCMGEFVSEDAINEILTLFRQYCREKKPIRAKTVAIDIIVGYNCAIVDYEESLLSGLETKENGKEK